MSRTIVLPLVADDAPTPTWQGLRAPAGVLHATEAPEPDGPQGEYASVALEMPLAAPAAGIDGPPPELLAPAGGLDAAYAGLHFGADAIYLGLKKFSARAEAENFSVDELSEIVAYAHELTPRRRVFVTLNTVIRQDEISELIDALVDLEAIGVDALIIQDLGVLHAVRRWFPSLELHASTQLAVHNAAGVAAMKGLGFARVVLARELTHEEIADVTRPGSVETEVFIHGALCYSYSGLCLFSAQTLGRSGNRGKCAYSCRDSFATQGAPLALRDGEATKRDPRQGFPFSMKDLALPDHLPALRAAGVSCFKIEGRKKSPLYVATTTDYYRRLLDGAMPAEERPAIEADLQTVFSRPWTGLFLRSHKDKEVADRDTVGHRGARVGVVEGIVAGRERRLRFRTSRALEKHDGIQVDLPTQGKPVGFAVDRLWLVRTGGRPQDALTVPAGSLVEIALPADAPDLPLGAPVYCASSQAVKQRYRHHRPKPGAYRVRTPASFSLQVTRETLRVTATAGNVSATASLDGPFPPAQDPGQVTAALRDAFARLGGSRFVLADFGCDNPTDAFVPLSRVNPVRRQVLADLDAALDASRADRRASLLAEAAVPSLPPPAPGPVRWSVKVDRIDHLRAFEADDWADVDEAIVDLTRDPAPILRERLDALASHIGRDRIRLALPPLTRAWEEKNVRQKIDRFLADGWRRWEVANVSGWSYLGIVPGASTDLDLATDWSLYVVNRLAARQMLALGASRFALSPEDGFANSRSLWTEFPEQAVLIVHQDTPLFLAESCAYANLIGGCPGKANCSFESMEMESARGEKVTAIDYHCRTIVLDRGPYCLSPRLGELVKAGVRHLRADFIYRRYAPEEAVRRWRLIRAGKPAPLGHAANWDRGLQ